MDILENRQFTKQFNAFARCFSLIVVMIGTFAMAGWLLDIPVFKSLAPGLTTMKANTALAFILAGISLWLTGHQKLFHGQIHVAQICSGLVLLIGSLTLGEYLFGWDLGIDQFLFRDMETPLASFPGRMAFASALCFVLIGISLLFIPTGKGKIIDACQYLAVIVLSFSLLALVGYIYDVQALYRIDQYSSMPLHTAVGCALLALGILSAQADRGWMRIISADTAGGVVLRRLLPFVLGAPIFIGWLVVWGEQIGWYETHFGLAMISVLTAGFLAITLWLISRQLNRIDADRKQAEEALHASEQSYRDVLDHMLEGAQIISFDWRYLYVNDTVARQGRQTKEHLLGHTMMEVYPGIENTELFTVLKQCMQERSSCQMQNEFTYPDGEKGWFDLSIQPVPEGLFILSIDITERKQAESALLRIQEDLEQRVIERTLELSDNEARFRGLFEYAPVSIWEEDFSAVRQYIHDLRAAGVTDFSSYFDEYPEDLAECARRVKIVDVNRATLEMYRAESKAQLLADLSQVLGSESLTAFKEEILSLLRGDMMFETEITNYTLRDEKLIIFLRLTVAPGFEQTWGKIFVGISDITKRRQAEAALRESEQRYRTLFESSQRQAQELALLDRVRQALAREVELPLIFRTVVEGIAQTFGYTLVSLYLVEGDVLVLQHQVGYDHVIERIPLTQGVAGQVVRSQQPILLEDVRDDPAFLEAIAGITSEVCVPLFDQDQVAGVLNVESIHGVKLSEADLRLMSALGAQIGIALGRARLYSDVRDSEQRFRQLAEHIQQVFWLEDSERAHMFYISPAYETIWGRTPQSLYEQPQSWLDSIHPDDRERVLAAQVQKVSGEYNLEYRVNRPDGTVRWIWSRAFPIQDEHGNIYRIAGIAEDITERKQVEAALAAERDLLQALMDNIPDTIYFKDTKSRFMRINRAQASVLGVASPQDAIGKTDLDFQASELAQSFYEEEQQIVQSGKALMNRIEYNPTPDGRPRWFSATKVPIKDADGNVIGIAGISRDITERKQIEDALREAENKYRALVEQLPAIVYLDQYDPTLSAGYRPVYISPQVENILGYRPEEFIENPDLWPALLHPDDRRQTLDAEGWHYKTGEPLHQEYRVIARDGHIVWLRDEGVMIKDEVNGKTFSQGVLLDITARKQAEEALQESEIRYRLATLATNDVIWEWNSNTKQLTWTENAQLVLGYSPEEISSDQWWDNHIHPEDRQRVTAQMASALASTETVWASEYRFLLKDGSYAYIIDHGYIERDASGTTIRMIGAMSNVTERKMAEEALRQSEERFRLISWATKDASWDWDLKRDQIFWGTSLQKVFHYSAELTYTDSEWWQAHIHPEDRDKVSLSIKQALAGGMEFWSKEYRFQRADGTYADIMDRGYILRNGNNEPYRMIGAMMDITERRQAEATILHHNEMLSSLHQITLDLLRHREISPLLNALVELAAKFMDAPHVEIMLVEDEALVIRSVTETQYHLIGERVGRGEAVLSWQAIDTREPVVLRDYETWPHRRAIYDKFPLHAVAEFPILNDEQCLGVLALGRDKPGYEFTFDQIQYGRLFANLTALVLDNAQLREALREQSIRDSLTGLYNRRYMEESLKRDLSRVTRQLHPLGIIMLDIDHFKRINDTYGHAMGDALLRELGQLLKRHIRREDIACRYGGEEFVLIMPDASLEVAQQRAEHLREDAKGLYVQDAGQSLEGITLSLGIAIYPQHGRNMETILRAADAALYRAKQEGRDRVMVAVG